MQRVDEKTASPPPRVDLPLGERIRCLRAYHTGGLAIRERFGPVACLDFGRVGPAVVFVSSARGAHDVLAARDGSLDKTGQVHSETRLLGDNSFTMPHEEWTPRRRTLQPVFTRQHVETYARHMAGLASATVARWDTRQQIDLDQEMRRLTLDVLGRSLFGLDLGHAAADRLAEAVPMALSYVTSRFSSPVTLPPWFPTLGRRRFRRALGVIDAVVDEAVAAYQDDVDGSPAELIRLLHEVREPETGEALTGAEIRDELKVFLLAGHDTTATTLTYALWQLGRDQALQDRVAAEVAALRHEEVRPGDLHALPLTTRVLHEAMRLCPPAAAIGRRVERDTVVDGYLVQAGSEAIVSVYALHRDPAAWEEPERFDPDRFLPERSEARDRWQYIPFGGGPRKCIGAHFAMLEAMIGLATLVRRARIESLSPTFPVALPFTLTAAGEVPARVSGRP